jgi:hypothetical protein
LVERRALGRDGKPVLSIPFVFHGPRHSRPEPDRLPLADIIAANLDHYRLDADYKHGLHLTVLPTAWVVGVGNKAPLIMGSRAAWTLDDAGGSAGFLEYGGVGLAQVAGAMEKVEQRMALLGARSISMPATDSAVGTGVPATTSVPATTGVGTGVPATCVPANGLAAGAELCGLGSIVAALNESLSRVLQIGQWWIEGGELGTQAARFAMNTDLAARAMSGAEIVALVTAWRAGGMSRESMLARFQRGEVLPDGRTVAQEVALIHGKRVDG